MTGYLSNLHLTSALRPLSEIECLSKYLKSKIHLFSYLFRDFYLTFKNLMNVELYIFERYYANAYGWVHGIIAS